MITSDLLSAVKNGDENIINDYLKNQPDIANIHNAENFDMTLLHVAVAAGNIISTNCLLNYEHADINATQQVGKTALHMASIKDNLQIMQLLVDSGIDVQIKDNKNKKAIDLAKSKKAVDLLSLPTINSDSFFLKQIELSNLKYLKRKIKESDRYLYLKFLNGDSLMHYAVLKRNYELMKILTEENFNLKILNRNGIAPIHLAVLNNDLQSVKFLINENTVNLPDTSELKPLHYYLAVDDPNNFLEPSPPKFIDIANDATITSNPLQTSFFFDFDNTPDITPCKKARNKTFKSHEIYELLVNYNAEITSVARNGITSLHLAAEAGNCIIIDDLIKRGADINAQTKTTGATPLHIAFNKQNHQAVDLLISNSANADLTDKFGRRYNELD